METGPCGGCAARHGAQGSAPIQNTTSLGQLKLPRYMMALQECYDDFTCRQEASQYNLLQVRVQIGDRVSLLSASLIVTQRKVPVCQFPLMASLKLLLHAAGLARLQFCYPSVQAQPRGLTLYSPEWVILAPPHDERACMAPGWNPLGLRKPLPEGGGGGGAGPRHPERTGWKPCGGAAGTTSMCGTRGKLWPMKLGRYVV